jgi:uncharacterized protein YndB with AHSA1/START domain
LSSKILVALRVRATPARTFDVFTREIGLWWRPNDLFRFTPRDPGVLAFEPPGPDGRGGRLIETLAGGKVFEIGAVRVWAPGERLVFGWRQATFTPDQVTEVEVRFEAVGEETRITLEHSGWDSVPAKHVARHGFPDPLFLRRHGEWWRALLSSMQARMITDGPAA